MARLHAQRTGPADHFGVRLHGYLDGAKQSSERFLQSAVMEHHPTFQNHPGAPHAVARPPSAPLASDVCSIATDQCSDDSQTMLAKNWRRRKVWRCATAAECALSGNDAAYAVAGSGSFFFGAGLPFPPSSFFGRTTSCRSEARTSQISVRKNLTENSQRVAADASPPIRALAHRPAF